MEEIWADVDFTNFNLNALKSIKSRHSSAKDVISRPTTSAGATNPRRLRSTEQNRPISIISASHMPESVDSYRAAAHAEKCHGFEAILGTQKILVPTSKTGDAQTKSLNNRVARNQFEIPHISRYVKIQSSDSEIRGSSRAENHRDSQTTLNQRQSLQSPVNAIMSDADDSEVSRADSRYGFDYKTRNVRLSPGASSLSMSMASTTESDDLTDGLEIPCSITNLRGRLKHVNTRRAAGDTIKLRDLRIQEDDLAGLILDDTSFAQAEVVHPHVKTSPKIARSSPRCGSILPKITRSGNPRGAVLHGAPVPTYPNMNIRQLDRKTSNTNLRTSSNGKRNERWQSGPNTVPIPDTVTSADAKHVASRQVNSTKPAFLAGGTSSSEKSHHITAIAQRQVTKKPGNSSFVPRTITKSGPPTPNRRVTASETLRAEAHRQNVYVHSRAKTYGDGHELDNFEDLPVCNVHDIKTARVGRKSALINSSSSQGKTFTYSDESKNQRRSSRQGQLSQNPVRRPSTLSNAKATSELVPKDSFRRRRKAQAPLLIANLDGVLANKSDKGMVYNPDTYRWEGNEEELSAFAVSSPPRPALITHITQNKVLQVANGMVFDPIQMCWMKMQDECDLDDPFNDISDIEESISSFAGSKRDTSASNPAGRDEFSVGEEFDVGPSYIKRQREQERISRSQLSGWILPRKDHARRTELYEIYNLLMDD